MQKYGMINRDIFIHINIKFDFGVSSCNSSCILFVFSSTIFYWILVRYAYVFLVINWKQLIGLAFPSEEFVETIQGLPQHIHEIKREVRHKP